MVGAAVLIASKTENTNAMLYELLESLGCDPIEAYPDESIGDLCERFNEAKAAGRPFGCVILDISRAGTPDSLSELTKLAGASLRVIMGDVRSMQERKIWEDSGWPQWLLRPVKLQRLKDVLSLINQEHRLDVKGPAPKPFEMRRILRRGPMLLTPQKSRMTLLLSILSRSGRLL